MRVCGSTLLQSTVIIFFIDFFSPFEKSNRLLALAEPVADSLHWWTVHENDSVPLRMLRAQVLDVLASLRHPRALSSAADLLASVMANDTHVSPDVRAPLYYAAARKGGDEVFKNAPPI